MEKNSIKTPKVSVCISVHNSASYLPRCLDSVCSQSLEELEIVLVNNGSTDNSEDIMREYADNHSERKFVIVAQEDRGLAQGRQTGIDNATGEYLTFLDADDYVTKTAYEEMYECAIKSNADIVSIDTMKGNELIKDPFDGLQNARRVLLRYLLEKDVNPMMWMRLYRRSLFIKPVLPSFYINNEDVFAFPCLLYSADKIFFLHKQFHFYSIDNEDSYMNKMKNDPSNALANYNRMLKARRCIPFMKQYMLNYENDKELNIAIKDFECHSIIFTIINNNSNFSFNKKSLDIAEILGFANKKTMFSYVKQNVLPNTPVKKLVKRFGLPMAYTIINLKKYLLR